jgi:hypothetical protein
MPTRRRRQVSRIAFTLSLTLLVLPMLVLGLEASAKRNPLIGTWFEEFVAVDCHTGVPTGDPPTQGLVVYSPGGSLIQSPNNTPFRTPGYGIWKATEPQSFLATFMIFNFTPDGTKAGSVDVTLRVTLGEDANAYTSTASVAVLDVDGQVIQTGCTTGTAHRLTFDQEM